MTNKEFKKNAAIILERLKKADNVLLSLHRSPDGDSVGANTAMFEVLKHLGKEATIISPDPVPDSFEFVPNVNHVLVQDVFETNLDKFDLIVLLDSSAWYMITNRPALPFVPSRENTVVIDHHITNEKMGGLNLVVSDISSTCELIFCLAREWRIELTKAISQCILTGMATDTGFFQFPNTSSRALKNAASLLDSGASLNTVVFNILRRNSLLKLKLIGKALVNLQIDTEHKFAYSTLSYKEIEELGPPEILAQVRESVANMFMQGIEGTEFGIFLMEDEPGVTRCSIRSRQNFDVSKIAVELGGGGHKAAAGAKIKKPLNKALSLVLKAAKKYIKKKR